MSELELEMSRTECVLDRVRVRVGQSNCWTELRQGGQTGIERVWFWVDFFTFLVLVHGNVSPSDLVIEPKQGHQILPCEEDVILIAGLCHRESAIIDFNSWMETLLT